MAHLNNPAGRLADLVETLRQMSDQEKEQPFTNAIRTAFKMQHSPRPMLLARIGTIVELPGAVEKALRLVKDLDTPRYLTWIEPVSKRFASSNFQEQLSAWLSPFDKNTMALLLICDDVLYRNATEPELDHEQLKAIESQAIALYKDIASSDLEDGIKQYMLRHLEIVIAALGDYRLRGVAAIQSGLEVAVGVYHTSPHDLKQAAASSFGPKVMEILAKFVLVVNSVEKLRVLSEAGRAVFGLLPDSTQTPHRTE